MKERRRGGERGIDDEPRRGPLSQQRNAAKWSDRRERNVAECSVADGGGPGGRERGVFEWTDPQMGFGEKGFGVKERFTSFGLK